jgi:hypothetical protein
MERSGAGACDSGWGVAGVAAIGLIMMLIVCHRPTALVCPVGRQRVADQCLSVTRIIMCRNIKTLHNFKPPRGNQGVFVAICSQVEWFY